MSWYSYIYSSDDLTRGLQQLDHREKAWKQNARIVLLLVNLMQVFQVVYIYYPYRLVQYFTNLTILATIFYQWVAILARRGPQNMSLLALHHLMFEIHFMMNFIVVVVFWSSLYGEAIADCHGDAFKIFNVWTGHTVPGITALINFLMTDCVFQLTHVKFVLSIGIFYGYINYKETKRLGRPIYWFFTWEDEKTFFLYGGFILIFSFLWWLICVTTLRMKPRPKAKAQTKRAPASPNSKRSKLE